MVLTNLGNVTAQNNIIDRVQGDYTNFTNVSFAITSLSATQTFTTKWTSQPATPPATYFSFKGRYINFTQTNNPTMTNLSIHWTDSELETSNESKFSLWKYNGSWYQLNNSPDTTNNIISAYTLTSFSTFALLEKVNVPPTKPNLTAPTNGNTTMINRTQLFTWNASTDADSDPINYTLNLSSDLCPTRTFTTNETNYTITDLNTTIECGVYYWNVTASDGQATNLSSTFNFSIYPTLILSFTTSNVDFGDMEPLQSNDTDDNSPLPFVIENNGNVYASIMNISANQSLFANAALPSSAWQFKADNTSELNSFNTTTSTMTFTNVSSSNLTLISNLNYLATNNSAQIDMKITVPLSEPAGMKQATITVYGAES